MRPEQLCNYSLYVVTPRFIAGFKSIPIRKPFQRFLFSVLFEVSNAIGAGFPSPFLRVKPRRATPSGWWRVLRTRFAPIAFQKVARITSGEAMSPKALSFLTSETSRSLRATRENYRRKGGACQFAVLSRERRSLDPARMVSKSERTVWAGRTCSPSLNDPRLSAREVEIMIARITPVSMYFVHRVPQVHKVHKVHLVRNGRFPLVNPRRI